MKLINKILLTTAALLFFSLLGIFLFFSSYAEVTPAVIKNTAYTQSFHVKDFSKVKALKGNWHIEIRQADSCSVSIYAGDNLLENYCDVSVTDNELTLDVKDSFKYFNTTFLRAAIYMPTLNKIELRRTSSGVLKNYSTDSLEISISDYANMHIDSSRIKQIVLNAKDFIEFSTFYNHIDEINYRLTGAASAIIYDSVKNISGTIGGNASIKSINFFDKSDSTLTTFANLLNFMPELKFYQSEFLLDDVMQTRYGAFRDTLPEYKDLIGDPYYALINFSRMQIYTYYAGKLFDEDVENWSFLFLKEILNDIHIRFKENDGVTWENIVKNINENYGRSLLRENPEGDSYILERVSWETFIEDLKSWMIINLSKSNRGISLHISLVPEMTLEPKYAITERVYTSTLGRNVIWDRLRKRIFENRDISLMPN
jgi:hypothetical protein